jgi:hypothetical protein
MNVMVVNIDSQKLFETSLEADRDLAFYSKALLTADRYPLRVPRKD